MKSEPAQPPPAPAPKTTTAHLDRRSFLTLGAAAAGAVLTAPTIARSAERDWSGIQPVRYPDADIIALDDRFAKYKIGNTAIQRLWTGAAWAEGCAWNAAGRYLVWSDIPNNRQMRRLDDDGHISVFRSAANNSNGNTFDWEGRQLSCEHNTRRVVRYEHDGSVTVLADKWDGKPLNAPNDIVVHRDGGIWFTDPGYGIMMNYEGHVDKMEVKEAIYRIDPKTAKIELMTDEGYKPNGLCFSPDFKLLYVADTRGQFVYSFQIQADGSLAHRQRYYHLHLVDGSSQSGADGLTVDGDGRLYVATEMGLQFCDQAGRVNGIIPKPQREWLSNRNLQ